MSDIDPTQRIQAIVDTYVEDGFLEFDATEVRMLRAVLAENETMRKQLAGLKAEWGVKFGEQRVVSSFTYDHEANAHHHAARYDDGETVSRLVGEWQPAEGGDAE